MPISCARSTKRSSRRSSTAAASAKIEGKIAVGDIVYPVGSDRAGEIIVESGQKITKNAAEAICTSGLKLVEIMEPPATPLLLNALADDGTSSHEEALLRIYQRLRPGNPPQLEKAKALFHEKFYDTNRYRLGRVGRFRINRKLGLTVPEDEMVLRPEDLINAVKYLMRSGDRRIATPTSTTSITWAIAVCARSTSWRPTKCARAS